MEIIPHTIPDHDYTTSANSLTGQSQRCFASKKVAITVDQKPVPLLSGETSIHPSEEPQQALKDRITLSDPGKSNCTVKTGAYSIQPDDIEDAKQDISLLTIPSNTPGNESSKELLAIANNPLTFESGLEINNVDQFYNLITECCQEIRNNLLDRIACVKAYISDPDTPQNREEAFSAFNKGIWPPEIIHALMKKAVDVGHHEKLITKFDYHTKNDDFKYGCSPIDPETGRPLLSRCVNNQEVFFILPSKNNDMDQEIAGNVIQAFTHSFSIMDNPCMLQIAIYQAIYKYFGHALFNIVFSPTNAPTLFLTYFLNYAYSDSMNMMHSITKEILRQTITNHSKGIIYGFTPPPEKQNMHLRSFHDTPYLISVFCSQSIEKVRGRKKLPAVFVDPDLAFSADQWFDQSNPGQSEKIIKRKSLYSVKISFDRLEDLKKMIHNKIQKEKAKPKDSKKNTEFKDIKQRQKIKNTAQSKPNKTTSTSSNNTTSRAYQNKNKHLPFKKEDLNINTSKETKCEPPKHYNDKTHFGFMADKGTRTTFPDSQKNISTDTPQESKDTDPNQLLDRKHTILQKQIRDLKKEGIDKITEADKTLIKSRCREIRELKKENKGLNKLTLNHIDSLFKNIEQIL